MRRPDGGMELLAPAGDMEALRAAVQNGADAVYLGAGAFNARRNAGNFDGDDLKRAVDYCHAWNVKVHVTLNTLVRQDELDALTDTIRLINESGADAVIVQDFGVARVVRQMAPALERHASTQMAAHNVQAARFLKAQGFDRVVLARECTYGDMAACAAEGIDVEVFVHGALCVACSGQCLMSSMVGGRSGNRGLCAQPCRLPWRLDGHEGFLLSTKDLCAIDDLPKLRAAGVKSLKIEGRMKRPEYVAVTVAAYRRALRALDAGTIDPEAEKAELRQMFNRGGFTRGYGPGVREDELMYPDRPNHIGVAVGRSLRPGQISLEKDVDPADALVIRRRQTGDMPVKLSGAAGQTVSCPQARKGDALVRLVSEVQMSRARAGVGSPSCNRDCEAHVTLAVGQPARLTVDDGAGAVTVCGEVVQRAERCGLDRERVIRQLAKTGGTPFTVARIDVKGDEDAFAPASMLNALRRDAVEALIQRRTAFRRQTRLPELPKIAPEDADRPQLYAQSGDPEVLRRALACGADVAVYCPEDLRHPDAEALPERFTLAVPAVLAAEALDALNAWANAQGARITGTILSNIGHFGLAWPGPLIADYLLNAGNDLAVAQLMDWGVGSVTPSVELTAAQIARMGGRKHLIVWGRIPIMHLRHCPLRAAEGMKGRHADCRHCDGCAPGERLNGRTLVDRKGAAFPLARVAMPGGCVVQVLNSVPVMPLRHLDRLPAASGWRLLLRPDEPIEAIVRVYRAAIDRRDPRALPEWKTLDGMETTTGHFFRGVD